MPPQGPVGVEAGGIDKVVSNLQETISNLRSSVNEIDSAAQAVLRGWKGSASDEFVKVAKAWHDESEDLNKRFDLFEQAVGAGKNTLVSMDGEGLTGGGGAASSSAPLTSL
ncbi:WXG100 family type VII secretion target [Nocardia sp. NPDC058519]|uniref:WXG100 family type VII secretion target n=1 Tax=unclassified Nocardia TaxID=2637762 RepID=UPI0036670F81